MTSSPPLPPVRQWRRIPLVLTYSSRAWAVDDNAITARPAQRCTSLANLRISLRLITTDSADDVVGQQVERYQKESGYALHHRYDLQLIDGVSRSFETQHTVADELFEQP